MENVFVTAPLQFPYPMCPRGVVRHQGQTSGLIVIIEKKPNRAPSLAKQLELAGFTPCVIAEWQKVPAAIKLPLRLVLVVEDQTVPLEAVWKRCRKIREHTDAPISILLSDIEQSDHIPDVFLSSTTLCSVPLNNTTNIECASEESPIFYHNGKRQNRVKRHRALLLDPDSHQVNCNGRLLRLTPSEYKILSFFMEWPERVFRREELIKVLYRKQDVVVPRVVDVHIGNLRKKIEPDLSCPIYIQSVRGLGYQLAMRDTQYRKRQKP